jgi:TIR domain
MEHTAAPEFPDGQYLFVCYAHDEREVVLEQIEWLRAEGFTVWYDEAIEAGSRWSEDLARAVDGCAAFLYFLSPRSASSRYCLDEVHFALECGRPIVPVDIAPVTLTPGLKLSIGGTHRLFMYRMGPEEFRRKLARGLREAMQGQGAAGHGQPAARDVRHLHGAAGLRRDDDCGTLTALRPPRPAIMSGYVLPLVSH